MVEREKMKVSSGVTLIELMVTIAIAAVLLVVAVPSFTEMFVNNRVRTQSDSMMASLAYARSEAISRAARVTVCKSDNRSSCTSASSWNQGWIIITDGGTEGTLDGTDQVLRVFEGNTSVTIAPPAGDTNFANYISYLSSGVSDGGNGTTPNGALQFCGSTDPDRQIDVNGTGRARVGSVTC